MSIITQSAGQKTEFRAAGVASGLAVAEATLPSTIIKLSSFTAADAKLIPFVTATAGSSVIDAPVATFSEVDVDKRVKVAGVGPDGADLFTTITSYQSPTRVTLATAAATASTSGGALIGTDCGPGLESALANIVAARGGVLLIDGLFYLETPVTQDFTTTDGISLTMQGLGFGTGILVAGTSALDMISIQNCPRLVLQNVNFAGCPMAASDCRRLLNFAGVEYIMQQCSFLGVSVAGVDNAGVVYGRGISARHFDNEFGGCIASSGLGTCIVDLDTFGFVDVERDRFLDYGRFQGTLLSKTGLGFCYAWLIIRDTARIGASVGNGSVVRITDCNMDEGHFRGLCLTPSFGRTIPQAKLSGIRVNNTLLEGGNALFLQGVDDLIIEQLSIGWANTHHTGLYLGRCGSVRIDGAYITDGANVSPFTGKPDGLVAADVRSLVLRNAQAFKTRTFTNLGSLQETIDEVGAVTVFSKRGRVTDTDFINLSGQAPPPSTIAYDEGNKKLYIKDRLLGWLATSVLTASTDATFYLNNGTPTRGTLTGADTYEKTSGAADWNTTANLTSNLTGGFHMAAKILVGTDVVLGAQNPDFPVPAGYNDFFVRTVLGGGKIYWSEPGMPDWGDYPYTLGDLIELIYDPTAATGSQMVLKIAGVVKGTHPAPSGLSPSVQHRFSSSLYNVGAKFQLLDYSKYS
jgi:hypothetical protein